MKSPIPLIKLFLRTETRPNSKYLWTQKLTLIEWLDFQEYVKDKLTQRGAFVINRSFEGVIRRIQDDYQKTIASYRLFNKARYGDTDN